MFDRTRLTPEQSRAVAVLENNFERWQTEEEKLSLEFLCTLNQTMFTRELVATSSLPRAEQWSWNQSRARTQLTSEIGGIEVCFYKLSTRKTPKATDPAPNIKLWIYNITIPILMEETQHVNFIWCEKGIEQQAIPKFSVRMPEPREEYPHLVRRFLRYSPPAQVPDNVRHFEVPQFWKP